MSLSGIFELRLNVIVAEVHILITATLCLLEEPRGDRVAFEGNLVSNISCVYEGLRSDTLT